MPRKPNYSFERKERERMKAEKKAKRVAEKQDIRDKKSGLSEPFVDRDDQKADVPSAD